MMKQLFEDSLLFGANAPFVEELYEGYLQNPASVPTRWREYFDKLPQVQGQTFRDVPHRPVMESFTHLAKGHPHMGGQVAAQGTAWEMDGLAIERKQISVLQLINACRFLGVRHANLDPLKHQEKPYIPELNPSHYGLAESDMDTVFGTGSLIGPARASLRDILQTLQQTYCGSIGVEYMYIADTEQKRWIQSRI
ncbi:MAG: 2-oxoglutarate dehydrogenase E1 subunit family protein, partial [Nitrosospira sp.]